MIKFLLDQNLSPKTVAFLRSLGWEAKDLRELGKSGADDHEIYELAKAGNWIFVTYDLDFSRRFMADKKLEGLILLRVHPQTVEILHPVLQDFLQKVKPEDLRGSIATLELHRYRLRKVRG
ncbi:hypothetical protein HRbin07_00290 [bacterium HR07]|uniref:Hypothetical conserved protein n=1 Tax=uncultured Acetothermia bacterium TaxID=236499 RepID=H5S912_9BACT|nr:hypothetical conserved protein [uncultured Acetothermia bacterium]GBC76094.1 hypothetical protein HRbin07_00290 [bacterium HR07]